MGKPAAAVMTSSPGLQTALAQAFRRERRDRQQIGRRAGIAQQSMPHANPAGKLPLELIGEPAGRQPEIERRIDQSNQFIGIEHPPRDGHRGLARLERLCRKANIVILSDQLEDLTAKLVGKCRSAVGVNAVRLSWIAHGV